MKRIPVLMCSLLSLCMLVNAQYPATGSLKQRVDELGRHKNVSVSVLTTTTAGNDIYQVTAAEGNDGEKPAIAVIGGIDGPSRYSVELVLRMAERLAEDENLTGQVSFYLFPDMTPDAAASYTSSPRYERRENGVPTDDDKDGLSDEDGYDDMNNDGMITRMRIRDTVSGKWIVHPENPYVMVMADPAKNEKGQYDVMYEGFDNDHDGKINEDVNGGVIFNKNFSFNYPGFTHGAGINTMSENESRALAKFLFDHWNVFAVLIIGPDNNLAEFNNLKVNLKDKSVPAEVSKADKAWFEKVVNLYNSKVRMAETKVVSPSGGDVLSWAYFHYNRFAFSTPAWKPAKAPGDRGSVEFDFLSGKSDKEIAGDVVPWQRIDHPDFEGEIVEVGGLKPFVAINPPVEAMDSLTESHFSFLEGLAALHPQLTLDQIKVSGGDNNIYKVQARLTNSGGLPVMTSLAEGTRWVKKVRVELTTGKGCELAGGRKVLLFDQLMPGESKSLTWLVRGGGSVVITAGSPQTGRTDSKVMLK